MAEIERQRGFSVIRMMSRVGGPMVGGWLSTVLMVSIWCATPRFVCAQNNETGSAADESAWVSEFAWMSGCWRAVQPKYTVEEMWTKPIAGSILGVNRTIKGESTIAHEFLEIRREIDGSVHYVASPSGQSKTTFTLVSMADGRTIFENLKHDFPQRIIYSPVGSDSLIARIEGPGDKGIHAVEFRFRREVCPN